MIQKLIAIYNSIYLYFFAYKAVIFELEKIRLKKMCNKI